MKCPNAPLRCEKQAARIVPQTIEGAPGPGRGGAERLTGDHAAQHYAAIIELSDDAVLSKDLDGVIMSWNHGAQRLFGYTAEEAVGRSVTMLIPTDRSDEEPMILDRVRRGERIDHYETVRQRKDGRFIDISLTVSPIKNEKGEVVGASKIARDITESKRAHGRQELLLREMDHRIKNLFALAIAVLRLSGRSASSVSQLIESASNRLSALARAHALTSRTVGGMRRNQRHRRPCTLSLKQFSLLMTTVALGTLAGFRLLAATWRFPGPRFPASHCYSTSSRQIPQNMARFPLLLGKSTSTAHTRAEQSSSLGRNTEDPKSYLQRVITGSAIFSFAPPPRALGEKFPETGSEKALSSGSLCHASA